MWLSEPISIYTNIRNKTISMLHTKYSIVILNNYLYRMTMYGLDDVRTTKGIDMAHINVRSLVNKPEHFKKNLCVVIYIFLLCLKHG